MLWNLSTLILEVVPFEEIIANRLSVMPWRDFCPGSTYAIWRVAINTGLRIFIAGGWIAVSAFLLDGRVETFSALNSSRSRK